MYAKTYSQRRFEHMWTYGTPENSIGMLDIWINLTLEFG